MTTRWHDILTGLSPDASGEVFFQPASILATTNPSGSPLAIFLDSATRDGLFGRFAVPKEYVDTAVLDILWYTAATSGDVDWDFEYRANGVGESMNQSGSQESVTVNDLAGTTFILMQASISLTDGNFAAEDIVEFTLFRDGVTESSGGIAASVALAGLFFRYNDA